MENSIKSTLIFDLERGQYWLPNKFGYTDDIDDAGRYSFDEAQKIRRESNMPIDRIETLIFDESNQDFINMISELLNKNTVIKKISIPSVLNLVNTNKSEKYYETNPYSLIVDTLEENGYFLENPDEIKDVYVDYGQSRKINIELKGKLDVNLTLTRMDSGRYEVVAYTEPKSKQERKTGFGAKVG